MKKKRVLFIAVTVTLAVLLIFNVVMLFYIAAMEEPPQTVSGVVFDPGATDERPNEGHGAAQGVTVAGFSALTVPAGVDTVAIDLYNPIENNGLYYMTFTLRLPDGEGGYEVLFETGYVPPGKHIYQVTLSRALPAGKYKAQLIIQPYRMSNLSTTNNVSAVVALTAI